MQNTLVKQLNNSLVYGICIIFTFILLSLYDLSLALKRSHPNCSNPVHGSAAGRTSMKHQLFASLAFQEGPLFEDFLYTYLRSKCSTVRQCIHLINVARGQCQVDVFHH